MTLAQLSRRAAGHGLLRLVLATTLVRFAGRADAVGGSIRGGMRPWLAELDEACGAVSSARMAPADWQRDVEAVLGRVALTDFLASIDFDTLAARARFPSMGEGLTRLLLPDDQGRAQPLHFNAYLFALAKGVAVVPHGHHNMATLHMMLTGQAHARHYDRLHSNATHMIIRPASDAVLTPAQVTTVSDDRDNIHWFQALTQQVFMFNIGVYRVQQSLPSGDRDYVDPLGGAAIGDGLIRAARMDRQAAYAKYGRAAP